MVSGKNVNDLQVYEDTPTLTDTYIRSKMGCGNSTMCVTLQIPIMHGEDLQPRAGPGVKRIGLQQR